MAFQCDIHISYLSYILGKVNSTPHVEAVGYGSVLKWSVGSVGKPLERISSAPVKKFIIVLSVTVPVVRKLS